MKYTLILLIGIPVLIALYFFVGVAIRDYFKNKK